MKNARRKGVLSIRSAEKRPLQKLMEGEKSRKKLIIGKNEGLRVIVSASQTTKKGKRYQFQGGRGKGSYSNCGGAVLSSKKSTRRPPGAGRHLSNLGRGNIHLLRRGGNLEGGRKLVKGLGLQEKVVGKIYLNSVS